MNTTVSFKEIAPFIERSVNVGGKVEITAKGRSMSPLLIDRKSIVRLTSPDNLRRGDMALYVRPDGSYVLHRIVSEDGGVFTMCGDAQWMLEKGVVRDKIIAKVDAFSRKGKRFTPCTSSRYGVYWRLRLFFRPFRHARNKAYRIITRTK